MPEAAGSAAVLVIDSGEFSAWAKFMRIIRETAQTNSRPTSEPSPMKRRTVLDLITNYRRAKRDRDPDETALAAAQVGDALVRTGILTEPMPTVNSPRSGSRYPSRMPTVPGRPGSRRKITATSAPWPRRNVRAPATAGLTASPIRTMRRPKIATPPDELTPDEAVQAALDLDREHRLWLRALLPLIWDQSPPASSPAVEFGRNLVRLAACRRVCHLLRSGLPDPGRAEDETALAAE